MKKITIQFCIALIPFFVQSQNWIGENGSNCLNKTISQVCEASSSYSSPIEAEKNLKEILDIADISRSSFSIRECSNVSNVKAVILKDNKGKRKRYILYNNDFIERFSHFGGDRDWGATSIIAHEVGHLVNGHGLNCEGSSHSKELEADEYSGIIMAKLGATLSQATAAIDKIPYHHATDTHPNKHDRKMAIKTGWASVNKSSSHIIKKPFVLKKDLKDWVINHGIKDLKELAARDNVIALRRLGRIYDYGAGVAEDKTKAVSYYKRAVKIGDNIAENNLGVKYLRGEGVTKDKNKALSLFRKACQKGNRMACNNIDGYYEKNNEESAKIEKIWVDHGFQENGKKGMLIHIKFYVYNKKEENIKVLAYFSFKNGKKLKDFNNTYTASDGQVVASKKTTPSFNSSRYDDLKIFIPYNELHMNCSTPGKVYNLFFNTQVYSLGTNRFIHKESKKYNFTYTCAK